LATRLHRRPACRTLIVVPHATRSAFAGTGRGTALAYNLVEAGAAAGRSKSSILRAIRRGALSAARDDTTGGWRIEEAELFRAFPPVASELNGGSAGTSRNRAGTTTIRELQADIAGKNTLIVAHEQTIDDLRSRLDAEAEERRKVQAQLTALLTDQRAPTPARRSWWPWLSRRQ
jgi:hypothetical protein